MIALALRSGKRPKTAPPLPLELINGPKYPRKTGIFHPTTPPSTAIDHSLPSDRLMAGEKGRLKTLFAAVIQAGTDDTTEVKFRRSPSPHMSGTSGEITLATAFLT
jgi:hypothetical protein